MLETLKNNEKEIHKLYSDKNIRDCIDKCNKQLSIAIKYTKDNETIINNNQFKHFLWNCYYTMGKCYKQMENKLMESINCFKESLNNITNGFEYIKSLWQMGNEYEKNEYNKSAVDVYKQCCAYYKKTNDDFLYNITKGKIAFLDKNIEEIKEHVFYLFQVNDMEYLLNGYDRREVLKCVSDYFTKFEINRMDIAV